MHPFVQCRTRILCAVSIILWIGLGYHAFDHHRGWNSGFETGSSLLIGVARAVAGFLAGVVLHRLYRKGKFAKLPNLPPESIYATWILISLVPSAGRGHPLFDLIAVVFLAPLAIALLVRGDKPVPRIYGWLGWLSYPLYVSQLLASRTAAAFLGGEMLAHRSILVAIPILAIALGSAWVVGYLANAVKNWPGLSSRSVSHFPAR